MNIIEFRDGFFLGVLLIGCVGFSGFIYNSIARFFRTISGG